MPDEPVATEAPPAAPVDGITPAPTVPPVEPPVVHDEPPVEFDSFLDESGLFKDGWKDNIPEDFRGRKVYDTFTDLVGLLKHVGHQDLVISRQGKGIMPLTDDASDTEREIYYKALGRPDKAEDYTVEIPEGLGDHYNEPLLKEAKEALHGAGLTQAQVDIVMALDAQRISASIKQDDEAAELDRKEAEKTLRVKWGTAYDERLPMAKRMIAENVAAEDEEKVLAAIGNHPHVIDFLANIAKKFMEGGIVKAEPTTGLTPAEAKTKMEEKIAEQVADPKMKNNNPGKFDRLTREINELAAKVQPPEI